MTRLALYIYLAHMPSLFLTLSCLSLTSRLHLTLFTGIASLSRSCPHSIISGCIALAPDHVLFSHDPFLTPVPLQKDRFPYRRVWVRHS